MKFYFTYGLEGHPYVGGWTEVIAPDKATACRIFRAVHPDKIEGLLNCCSVYSEQEFAGTTMSVIGNFGERCKETITVDIERE